MIDRIGREIIAQRNGFGAAKTLSAEDQQLLSRMQSNRQARAVLGITTQYLRRGYEVAQTVPSFISPIDGTKQLATQMRSLLDSTNRRAQQVYNSIPDDDAPLSPQNRRKVEDVMIRARDNLATVSTDAEDMNRGLTGALADMLTSLLPKWLQPSSGKTRDTLLYVGLGVAALVGVFIAFRLVSNIVLGGAKEEASELRSAERAALAAMRKRAKKVLTIS